MVELAALGVGLAIGLVAGRPTIAWLRRLGARQFVRDDGPARHLAKAGTPTMGGTLLLVSLAVAFLAVAGWLRALDGRGLLVLGFTAASAAIGFADDWSMVRHGRSLGLRARHKLVLQFVLAGAFLAAMAVVFHRGTAVGLPFTGRAWEMGAWYYPFAALLLVGLVNAVNLTDGLDGLAGGLTAIVALALAVLAVSQRAAGAALFSYALAGACLGFLVFNVYPAKVFMGDTGSLALGAALGGVAVLLQAELWIVIFGLVFFVEMASVVLQVISFRTTGRRIFRMSPLHHHFELGGRSEPAIVLSFWSVAAAICAISLLISSAYT